MKGLLYFELRGFEKEDMVNLGDHLPGVESALRVILSSGGYVRRETPLSEWRAGDAKHGHRIAEKYVEALVNAGFLLPRFIEKEAS